MRPTRPRDLPDLRTAMIGGLRPGGFGYACIAYANEYDEREQFTNLDARLMTGALAASQLWWATKDMCQLVEVAAATVPDDTPLADEMICTPVGLCVFEQPLAMTGRNGDTGHVDAVMWHRAIHPTHGPLYDISSFAWSVALNKMAYLGGSWWVLGDSITDDSAATLTSDEARESRAEDRRLIAALSLLATQPGLTESRIEPGDRATARRAKRDGMTADVRVVSIRQIHHDSGEHRDGSTPSVRFLVSGHWRNQSHGPNHSLRRPTWIAPYTKGPDGAPLRVRQTVRVLAP